MGCPCPRRGIRTARRPVRTKNITVLCPTAQAPLWRATRRTVLSKKSCKVVFHAPNSVHTHSSGTRSTQKPGQHQHHGAKLNPQFVIAKPVLSAVARGTHFQSDSRCPCLVFFFPLRPQLSGSDHQSSQRTTAIRARLSWQGLLDLFLLYAVSTTGFVATCSPGPLPLPWKVPNPSPRAWDRALAG